MIRSNEVFVETLSKIMDPPIPTVEIDMNRLIGLAIQSNFIRNVMPQCVSKKSPHPIISRVPEQPLLELPNGLL